jgi:hypothetical protein
LPAIAWCDVPGGETTLIPVGSTFRVKPFQIGHFP